MGTYKFKTLGTGLREQMKNIKDSEYSELTEQTLGEYLMDISFNKRKESNRDIKLYILAHEDENGNIIPKGLEEFDKAMKEELNK